MMGRGRVPRPHIINVHLSDSEYRRFQEYMEENHYPSKSATGRALICKQMDYWEFIKKTGGKKKRRRW